MSEVFFIVTTVFIAYIVYVIVNEPKTSTSEVSKTQPEQLAATETQKPTAQEEPANIVVEEAPKTEEKPTVAKVAVKESSVAEETVENKSPVDANAAAPAASKAGLKNPKTGEVVLVYNNYRFLKRWIKEALVSEGLLSKIYKNNELNAGAEEKIKTAMAKLEAMDKYRA